ncbi:hypothetical protein D9756_006283 [Leucocoprinus leucothites]|uniref:DUF6534 domain-containing protein n=1 Tax=Leucocoprinus leucothites TaxID=201217 RepID=A0A8H5FXS4_9AGAR|nr:hypothetical protein D9756_006283 [Leucoagaricus leucothites]
MASSPVPLPANAPSILGPPLVGIVLNWFFYGILVMQYFMYFNHGRRDKKWLRATVHFMFLLDTLQSFMMMDDLFFWFVYNFNDYSAAVYKFNFATVDGPFLDAFIMFIAQLVYCWRLKELGRWTILPVATALLALISCACGMFIGIRNVVLDSISAVKYAPVEDVWLLASAVTDIIIASSMTYLLMKYQKEYRFVRKGMMTRVKRIILLTLETNAITAAFGIALFFCFIPPVAELKTNVLIALGSVIGKMCYFNILVDFIATHCRLILRYSNCFMVLLNQRIYYDNYAKANPTTGTFGGSSGIQGDCQNETTGPPMSMLQFNDTGTTTVGTSTTTTEHGAGAKNGLGLASSVPSEVV